MGSIASVIESEAALIRNMTEPTPAVREAVAALEGDVLVLGVGGKMGPTLAELVVRAGCRGDVIGVARFSDGELESYLHSVGVKTVRADLLDEDELERLPQAPNVFFLAGFKFGATGNEPMTWAMNTWLPGRIVQQFSDSSIVYVSSGNVYAYSDVTGVGSPEDGDLGPVGEYAQSRLGGERMATYAAQRTGTRLLLSRLFYATELRYGIIHDIAWKVLDGGPIDLAMGHVNQIWQGDANAFLARSMPLCTNPPTVLNLTGSQVLLVRELARRLGEQLDREPHFIGTESAAALLGDSSRLFELLGHPETPIDDIVRWMAHWVKHSGRSLGKPTKYESRTGAY